PPEATSPPGVLIDGTAAVTVTITNDFSAISVLSGNLQLMKAVVAGASIPLPASYTARVVCNDGTDTNVTLPGTGGPGSPPVLSVPAGASGAVGEDTSSLPAGWVLTYSVDGGPPSSSPPVFTVTASATVTVTITNDPTAVVAPTTPPPTEPP